MKYRTRDNDILDKICHNHYGISGVVHKILEANPRLADYGPILPAGILIELPEISVKANNKEKQINLWD